MKRIWYLTLAAAALFCFLLPASAAVAGDVDGSGEADVSDARWALRAAVGLDTLTGDAWHLADADGNGEIEVGDARRILRAAVGLEQFEITSRHAWENGAPVRAATCTAEGELLQRCSLCGAERSEAIPQLPHTSVADPAVAATCTADGKTAGSHCAVCGTVLTAQETVKATGHQWNAGKITTASTCTKAGVKTYTCTVCKTKKTEAVKAAGHKAVTDPAVAATCTADGKTAGSHCSVCGTVLTAQETVKAAGHQWNAGKITTASTCTKAGVKTYTCTVCKTKKTEAVKAAGHKAVTDPAVAATCTADGKTAGSHCAVCGAVLTAQETVKAAGHQWNAGKITTASTCTKAGVKTYTCTVCKTKKTEAVKAAGHKAVTDPAVAATCTVDGKTAGSHCSVCGAVLTAQETVKAAGHTWNAGKIITPATCTATGEAIYTCTVCGTEKTEITKMLSHAFSDDRAEKISCTEPFSYTRTCARCGASETVNESAAGHDYGGNGTLYVDRDAVCSRCGDRLPSFNSLVNELKINTHFYRGFVYSSGKGEIRGTPKLTISSAAKLAALFSGEKLDKDTLLSQLKQELTKNSSAYSGYIGSPRLITDRNFTVEGESYVSALKTADVSAITVADAQGVDFIAGLPDKLSVRNAQGETETVDLTKSVKAAKIGAVKKVTVTLKEEKYSRIKNQTSATALQRGMGYDLRALVNELNRKEDQDGMLFEMKCGEAAGKGKITYYFDSETWMPIAAVYDVSVSCDQSITLDAKVGGVSMMSGNINVALNNSSVSYYFFDGYFEPKS